MGAIHVFNQGIIGPNNQATYPEKSGAWQLSSAEFDVFINPTPISTDIGYSHDEPDSNRQYVYSSRNLTVFYTDSYGTNNHVNMTSGTKGGYTDARLIGNNNGIANADSFLVNNSNSKVGYVWEKDAKITGFRAHGKYSNRTFSNNGTLDILYWDGVTWREHLSDLDITQGGTVDWGTSTVQQYDFAQPVVCRGLAIQANSVSTYWTINYFAPLIENNTVFLGHQ